MTISSSASSGSSPAEGSSEKSKQFSRLRQVLLGPEQSQLHHLQQRLDDFTLHTDEVSRVLPDAIRLRAQQDHRLLASMIPVTQEALAVSIRQSPHLIVDTVAPILGPAIRKASVQAMRGMLQSLNQTLEYSMSWKGLQWRWEAWRTGRSFAEVVLLHTLHFRVEQVFLIHKETGLLLNHVVVEGVNTQGEELISSMLTAIQNFVRDSFGSSHEDELESLRIGELTVWVEQGPHAILAGVIRGTPPMELRRVFQETLEAIHAQFSDSIQNFQGDTTPFYETRLYLEDCLQAQFVERPSRIPWIVWVLLLIFGLTSWFWGTQAWSEHQQWNRFFQAVGKESGIVITSSEEHFGKTTFYGLRDPLARDPGELLKEAGHSTQNVSFHLEPFLDLTPKFIQKRALSLLAPPQTVTMQLEGSRLILRGEASHSWISRALSLGPLLPGVTDVQHPQLVNRDWETFLDKTKEFERKRISFDLGESRISEQERSALGSVLDDLQALEKLADGLAIAPTIEIQGFSSPDGTEDLNWVLSRDRAHEVLKTLSRKPLRRISLKAVGKGPEMSLLSIQDKEALLPRARRVSFKVYVDEPSLDGMGGKF